MSTASPKWVDVGRLDDIPVRGARLVRTPSGCIAVFRTAANEAYAIEDKCPHKAGPLSQGIVHGKAVTCPLHNWVISLKSGEAQGPDKGQTRTFSLKVDAGRLLLDISTLTTAKAA